MSAGGFFNAKYGAETQNGGGIHPIKVQPETLTLEFDSVSNASPSGAVSNRIRPNVGGSKRKNGLSTRMVYFKFVTAPTGYEQGVVIGLPWLDPSTFASLSEDQVGSYAPLGTAEPVTLVGKSPEYPTA